MKDYKVKAGYFGNTLHFNVRAGSLMEAYKEAHKEARRLFDCSGLGQEVPVVDVREMK